ncbi:MAG TPA: RNA polymerase sigma factor [Armatimonadaceae bacterium]|nr:RNA polymerase sigma factor [Armatimonadaceae bacterium]
MDEETINLVNRVRCGDAAAYERLVRRFQDRTVAYARSLLRDAAEAEDAAQDAFVLLWREMPALREPAAFPSFLRRLVFKCADRIRRRPVVRSISLDAAGHADGVVAFGRADPALEVIREDDARRVRAAVHALPHPERQAALLYYFGEHDLAEISEFLGVPRTTVKNRLHAARKRLRKELWTMAEETMPREAPSRNEMFVQTVLVRTVEEYRRQRQADPHAADRGLLREGRAALDDVLATDTLLAWGDAQAGFLLLEHQNDRKAQGALLSRYLAQPLDESQRAWALLHLANAQACGGEAVGAVLAHEALELWLPGRSPRLSAHWPYYPAAAGEAGNYYEGTDQITLLALGKSAEFAFAWVQIWRKGEYLAKVEDALERVPPESDGTRELRFSCLRMACSILEKTREFERARRWVERMYTLAGEVTDEHERGPWYAKALGHDVRLFQNAGDRDAMKSKAAETGDYLARFGAADWVRGERHNLACQCAAAGDYPAALELFEQNSATGGQVNGWGWLVYAASVWKASGDRARTVALLREAAARDDRDLTRQFESGSEFAGMIDAPEFMAALRRPE